MERTTTILLISLYHIGSSAAKEYNFVPVEKNWADAQTYCRQHYTDLAYVHNVIDQAMIMSVIANISFQHAFIGLTNDNGSWRWSIGSELAYTYWYPGRPRFLKGAIDYVGGWTDVDGSSLLPFICVHHPIVEEKKTWEEALEHCRDNDTHLGRLHSDSERLALQMMMQKVGVHQVWIGLRFLTYSWLCVDGGPLVYEAWSKQAEPDLQCPLQNRCAAGGSEGLWETLDCQEKRFFICDMKYPPVVK